VLAGADIARQLKWELGLEETRIIATTGLPLHEVRQRALDAGCVELYAKPISGASRVTHGSRDQLYCRYGYFMGLKQALAMLTSRDATVH